MDDQKNLLIAIVLSLAILLGFQLLFPAAAPQQQPVSDTAVTVGLEEQPAIADLPRDTALALSPRISLENAHIRGSLSLAGARFDDVALKKYNETVADDSETVTLLNPSQATQAQFAEFGWLAADNKVAVPQPDSQWQVEGNSRLTPETPVILMWDNGAGLKFRRIISTDNGYVISINETVENTTQEAVTLYPYARIQQDESAIQSTYQVAFTGPLGVVDDTLKEIAYKDLLEKQQIVHSTTGGWLGISSNYWLAALLPDQTKKYQYRFAVQPNPTGNRFQVDYRGEAVTIEPKGQGAASHRLFAGAKEVAALDSYMKSLELPLFDRAVDFGWLYFLTKPFTQLLHWIYIQVGNFGVAIIILTLIVRFCVAPLAHKSYKSMLRMKDLQPRIMEMKERYGDDRMGFSQEMMKLYKKEQVNPASGCLPILLQIPIFFALYKVFLVSIEARHAPFFGWIQDLSAPDPTSFVNLFGLLDFTVPSFLVIGVWPILVGITMFISQQMNPPPPDKIAAQMFRVFPFIIVVISASFPAGLAVYWTASNIFTIFQQRIIKLTAAKSHEKFKAKKEKRQTLTGSAPVARLQAPESKK